MSVRNPGRRTGRPSVTPTCARRPPSNRTGHARDGQPVDVPELSSSQRVLIVEDDEQLGEPVAAFLGNWGNRPQRLTRPECALAPEQNIVLRAGGADDVVNESRSLFRSGAVCDVPRIVGAMVACYTVGVVAPDVYCTPGGRAHAVLQDGTVVRLDGREKSLEAERPGEPTVTSRS